MPFKGVLQRTAFNIDVTPASGNSDATAVTIAKVVKRDRFTDVDTLTVGAGLTTRVPVTIGAAAARIIVQLHCPTGGSTLVKVSQGATLIEETIVGDGDLVFDIAP